MTTFLEDVRSLKGREDKQHFFNRRGRKIATHPSDETVSQWEESKGFFDGKGNRKNSLRQVCKAIFYGFKIAIAK